MFSLVKEIGGIVKPTRKVYLENFVFRLHTSLTTAAFIICSGLVTAKQLIGDPIRCIGGGPDAEVINNYCWIQSTFSVKTRGDQVGYDIPYHGVGTLVPDKDHQVYRAYYQWVPLLLFFQGLLYILPHFIWKSWEGGKLKDLTKSLGKTSYLEDTEKSVSSVVRFLTRSFHQNNSYAIRFFICEVLNFVNDIGNIYFINAFLGGEFMEYGFDVVSYAERSIEQRRDPMILLFPRLTKCTFHKYGPSGTLQRIDSLCVLNLNIINEKIYIFLWFWLIILSIIGGLAIVYRLSLFAVPQLRAVILKRSKGRLATDVNWECLGNKCNIGDFFLLKSLSDNMNEQTYTQLVTEYAAQLECIYPTAPHRSSIEKADSSYKHV